MMGQVLFMCPAPAFLLVRKFILLKDQFVKLSANPHSAAFREHHGTNDTRFRQLVHIYFSSIFKPCLARIVPCCKQANVYKHASRNHANPKTENPVRFAPISTSVRKRGKTPENGIFIETMKSDPYIQIITYRRQWPAIPIPPFSSATAKPDCQRSGTIAIPFRHTIPATPRSPHDPTRSPIRHDHTPSNPVHYIQRYTLHAAA